jgi:hypothetical protein
MIKRRIRLEANAAMSLRPHHEGSDKLDFLDDGCDWTASRRHRPAEEFLREVRVGHNITETE